MGIIYAELEPTNADDIALARKGYINDREIKKSESQCLSVISVKRCMLAINEDIQAQL